MKLDSIKSIWNTIIRIVSSSKSDKIKLEGKSLLRQLDSEEGKNEATEFIKKHDKSNWTSWD